jgi:hypothetical protein
MNKRGMTTVVTSLILILIAIVVLSIVGVVVNNLIRDKSDQFITDQFTTDLVISNVQVLSETEMQVTVKRNPGEGNVVGIAFVAYDFNGSEVVRKNIPLKELEQKNFQIILEVVNASEIQKIAIAPIFGLDSGKELTGEIQYERKVGGEGRVISSGGSSGGGNGDSGGSEDSSDSSDESSEENGDTFPRIYWQYQGSEVTILNDIPYGSSINLVLEDSGLDPGTQGNFEIYDYDLVGGHDLLDTVTFFIGPEGNAFVNWIFEESVIDKARDLFEGNRLELYFVFLEIESEELDINFTGFIEENCFDGLQNQDETGVDCGGSICEPCLSQCQNCINGGGVWCESPVSSSEENFCSVGRRECVNSFERRGIPYQTNCPNCSDGIQNQDETEIDCGGPCPDCPTCSDGIQNQGELMVDCGGPNCPLCECESGSDCPGFDYACVQGYCQICGPEFSGLGCSSWEFPWWQGTCAAEAHPGTQNGWACRKWPLISFVESSGYHYWRFCRETGSLCAANKGGDFVAEGICPRGTDFFLTSSTEVCDTDEMAVDLSSSPPRYYSDCSEVGTPRDNEDLYCDSDVSSPTVGFNWDGICNCGACQTSLTNPCSVHYNNLNTEVLKQEILNEVNWERDWVMGGRGIFKMYCYQEYPKNCFWREYLSQDLILDQGISEASRLHSQDMADNNYIFDKEELYTNSQSNLEGLTSEERIAQAGYTCLGAWEITDRIYVREGMSEKDVSYYLARGNGGEWYDNIAPNGEGVDDNMWFGNRYLLVDGNGNPSETNYEWYEIYPRFSVRYWVATENAEFDTAGIGTAKDNKGRLYVTFTFCNNYQNDYKEYPIDEDPRCEYNHDPPIPWCNGNYNNHPHCYSYWSLYKMLGGEEEMSLEEQNLRYYCMQWNPFPTLSLNYPNGDEVLIGDVISVPTTLTFNMKSTLFFIPGETLYFEIWDEDTLGDDYIETISGVVQDDYSVSIPWDFDQGVVDAAYNWGEGSTFEIYFKFLSEETTIIELGYS